MTKPPDTPALDDVLANRAWIRRLAHRLVADAAERDEVVQQVWLAALTQAPRADELRPWLAGVLRNVARMRFRAGERRRRHEERAETATPATPEELVGRVEVERDVANALLEVDEPYRTTLLLRYYEDLSAAEIARRLAIPAATVRSRLKRGLDELRARLDAKSPDDRRRWALALVPTAAAVRGGVGVSLAVALGGALIMKATVKIIAGIVALVLLLWIGSRVVHAPMGSSDVTHARAGTAWRMPGGIAVVGGPQPTVAGVVIPGWFGQSGAPVRRIAGRVIFAGAPVAGATVELGSALTDVAIVRPATRITGGDGTFDFGVQPPARYSVAAAAAHHSPAVVELDTRDPTIASEKVELRLGGCESALFGHVTDASGGPIAGARLCYAPPRATACVATDGDGAYELCVSPQQMSVQVSASGYGAITQDIFNNGYSGRRMRRDFALTPEATIRGRVVRGSDGSPVVGAAVRTAVGDIGPRLPAPGAAVTDENGRFSVGGLAPGRHRVVAFAAGLATSEPVDVNAEAGHGTPEIVLRLQAASSIRGVVVDGNDPVAGATVFVPRFGEIPGGDAVTQSDGSFVLDAVPRGVVTLRVRPYEVKTPKTIVVDRPQLDGVRIVVEAMGSIAGRVTRFGKPYAGIGVFCPRAEVVFTDNDGNYVVRGLRAGKYQIVAQDGRVGGGTNPGVISLDGGEHRTGADIDLQYAGSIAGVVVEENGAPVGGVAVRYSAVHKEDLGEDTTAPDGSFVVGTLVGGDDYQPIVRPNMNSATRLVPVGDSFAPVTVADGAANVTGVRLVVKRDHQSIEGSTVGGDGQPIGDVHVTAFRVDSDETPSFNRWFDHPSAISAVDGHFSIDDLDAGRFVLEARAGDGSEATVKNIAAGQKNVVITLQSSGAIDGLLVGFTTPPSEVAAKLDNPMSQSLRSLATIDGDSFHFRGLAAGSYLVAATGGGAGDSQIVQVQAGQTATVTLHNHGSASVHGHVSEWRGGAPVVGMNCQAMVDSPSGTLMWGNANPSYSDNNGDFTLDGVAAGSNRIICGGGMPFYSNGIAHVQVVDGQPATVSIPVVKRREGGVIGDIGAEIASDSALVARIASVDPQGAFARAGLKTGDIVVSVDGASVTKLAPMGIDFAIGDRPLGSHAAVGVTRAGKEIVADVLMTTPLQF